jgi:hypothetical protein
MGDYLIFQHDRAMTTGSTDRQIRLENAELLRGLVASVDNMQAHMNAMQGQVSEIRDKVIGMEARDHGALIAALSTRLTALESANQRREGATGIIEMIMKSPTLGWIVGAGTAVWAFLSGKLHI